MRWTTDKQWQRRSVVNWYIITVLQRSCGKVMFSIISVCLSTGDSPCDHYLWCIEPHHTGTPLIPAPRPCPSGYIQTCSTWTSLYRDPAPDMFKPVYFETRMFGMRAVGILVECFLVISVLINGVNSYLMLNFVFSVQYIPTYTRRD